MKPLCKKTYIYQIFMIITILFVTIIDILSFINIDIIQIKLYILLPLSIILAYSWFELILWLFQPHILIYQTDDGIIIKRNIEIKYVDIEKIYYKNYTFKDSRHGPHKGNYYKSQYIGTIYILLKSNKLYKIKNASDPIDVCDILWKIKKQRKYK